VPVLHVRRSRGRHEAEEQEHEDLAQPGRRVGSRAAAVAEQRDERAEPDDEQPPAHHRRQHQTGGTGDADRDEHRGQHALRRHQAARDRAPRAGPGDGVDAADAVEVVVGVVDRDLHAERDDEREQESRPHQAAVDRAGGRADEDRRRGRGQRARARGLDPHLSVPGHRDALPRRSNAYL